MDNARPGVLAEGWGEFNVGVGVWGMDSGKNPAWWALEVHSQGDRDTVLTQMRTIADIYYMLTVFQTP